MSSGVQVSQEVKDAYEEIKKGKKTPYAIFRIDETIVVLDKKGKEGATFEDFKNDMVEATENTSEGRYAVFDVKNETSGHSRLLFCNWVDDNKCKIKSKMLYASSKSNCMKALEGQTKEIQLNDPSDFVYENFVEVAFKK